MTDDKVTLLTLETAAEKMGCDVRYQSLGDDDITVSSGSCRVNERRLILIDKKLDDKQKWTVLAKELKKLDSGETYIFPLARKIMDSVK